MLSDFASITALIPALFGVLIVIMNVLGRQQPAWQRFAAYGIGLLAVLGVLGSMRGIPAIIALLTGDSVDSVIAALVMAGIQAARRRYGPESSMTSDPISDRSFET